MAFVTGCTKTTRIPESDYLSIEPNDRYYIKTVDGSLYSASRVAITDSTLVIYEPIGRTFKSERYPIELSLRDVEGITAVGDVSVARIVGISVFVLGFAVILTASTAGPILN